MADTPIIVYQKVVRGNEHREPGGRIEGGSRRWEDVIELFAGWEVYDYAIHIISQRNASASVSMEPGRVVIRGRTRWDALFGRGGNYKYEATVWFMKVFMTSDPPPRRHSVLAFTDDVGRFGDALGTIGDNIAHVTFARADRVGFRTDIGKYICAEGGGGREVNATRDARGPWETFRMIPASDNKFAFMADNGQYVCAEGGGGRELVANRNDIGAWERFTIEHVDGGRVALRAHNGQYVCAEGGGGREVNATREARGPWETFQLERV